MTEVTGQTERPIIFSGPMVRAILAGRKTQTRRVVQGLKQGERPERLDAFSDQLVTTFAPLHPATGRALPCPYGRVGHRLWVRETVSTNALTIYPFPNAWYRADFSAADDPAKADHIGCKGNQGDCFGCWSERHGRKFRWRPAIHMRRSESRITLEITDVRVERLQEISDNDAQAEGLDFQVGDGTGPGPGFKWDGTGYRDAVTSTYHVSTESGYCCCKDGQALRLSAAPCAYRSLWDSINASRAPWESNPFVWVVSFKVVV